MTLSRETRTSATSGPGMGQLKEKEKKKRIRGATSKPRKKSLQNVTPAAYDTPPASLGLKKGNAYF